jgi:hypothetical protein
MTFLLLTGSGVITMAGVLAIANGGIQLLLLH